MYEVSHPSGGSLVGNSVPGLGLGVPGVGLGVVGSEVVSSVVGGIVVPGLGLGVPGVGLGVVGSEVVSSVVGGTVEPGLGLGVPGVGLGVVGSEVVSSVVGGIVDGDGVLGVGIVVIGVGFGKKLIDSSCNRSKSLWLKYKNPLGSQRSTISTGPYETAFDSHTYSRASTSKNASDPSEASNSRFHVPFHLARFASSGATTIVMNKNNESKNLMVPKKIKAVNLLFGFSDPQHPTQGNEAPLKDETKPTVLTLTISSQYLNTLAEPSTLTAIGTD